MSLTLSVSIRRAVQDDIDQIMDIEHACFSDPWERRSMVSLIADRRVFFTIAHGADGRVLGYVTAWFLLDEGEIGNLAVISSARSCGVGSRLLDAATAHSFKKGVTNLFLEVRESNSAARRLYASRNFVEIGRRKSYYRQPVEDAVILRLRLS